MSKQGIDFNDFEALDILWLIIFLIAIAIAVILMWGKFSAFSTTISITRFGNVKEILHEFLKAELN